ncbi:hypothetical protein EIP86_001855 [Pleurotus ostreatoroseus]|nr:hypothetical protein EIP86_001855 [Pleurotus ostreatoroseus]
MPLLYESVFISNMAQLKTLAATLQERPEIGPKIRRLRLKDAFGRDLPAVLSLTPNIHTLSVCTKISSRTSITGLRALLKTSVVNIAPTRLMIEPPFHWRRSSVVQENMAKCLIALVSNWPDVVSRYFRSYVSEYKLNDFQRRIDIGSYGAPDWCFQLLREAKGLEYIGIGVYNVEKLLQYEPDIAAKVVARPGFKNILHRGPKCAVEHLQRQFPVPATNVMISEPESCKLVITLQSLFEVDSSVQPAQI